MRHLFFIFGIIFFFSCSSGDTKQDQDVFWVNSTKVNCVGLAPSKCIQIQKSEILDPEAWETFHASIIGFEYEPGYIYKLLLKENQLDPAQIPADASSIKYILVEILEKRHDLKFRINDIWEVTEINGLDLQAEVVDISQPRLEINVGEMRYMGNDGCNNYNGGIIELDDKGIRFGIAAGTRMMCMDMTIPDLFNSSLPEVRSWKRIENGLIFLDAHGKEIMKLRKTD